jgi:hypothetical protein
VDHGPGLIQHDDVVDHERFTKLARPGGGRGATDDGLTSQPCGISCGDIADHFFPTVFLIATAEQFAVLKSWRTTGLVTPCNFFVAACIF